MGITTLNSFFPAAFLDDSAISNSLGEEFSLCDNGNMVFHWADFHETCDNVKERLENDPGLMDDFKRREAAIGRLQLIPIWIKTKNKFHQLTMFDLYELYITDNSHLVGELDVTGQIEVSFISPTGPFKEMAITQCFSQITYKDFILVYLLKDKLPRRDYRIRLKSKVLMEFGPNFERAQLINLEQMTMTGLLFSIDSEIYQKELTQVVSVRTFIETQTLKEAIGKNLSSLQSHLSQHAFNLLFSTNKQDAIECSLADLSSRSSFDFLHNKKLFLFMSYDVLAKSSPAQAKAFKDFMTYSRELVRAHYRDLAQKSRSA
jgi:hypothetical protein